MIRHDLTAFTVCRFAALGMLNLAVCLDSVAVAQEPVVKPQKALLVSVQQGDLPIILSAPHGGTARIPGVEPRRGENVPKFVSRSDVFTGDVAQELADEMEIQSGKRPYVVIARFHRKYLDANRPKELAFESQAAEPAYQAYHQALADAREDITRRWGYGLLLDIHGQASEPQAIIRGTQNGKTVHHLVQRFGQEALIGESSLFGRLAEQGFQVIPPVNSLDREHPKYNGGYIVWTQGSRIGGTVDAIQLELGRSLRSPSVRSTTVARLASATLAFHDRYLP